MRVRKVTTYLSESITKKISSFISNSLSKVFMKISKDKFERYTLQQARKDMSYWISEGFDYRYFTAIAHNEIDDALVEWAKAKGYTISNRLGSNRVLVFKPVIMNGNELGTGDANDEYNVVILFIVERSVGKRLAEFKVYLNIVSHHASNTPINQQQELKIV